MKKLSVIVPVYNVEEHLGKCLESLVKQTLEDIEIIVVNDGSTDGSQAVIDSFVSCYPEKVLGFKKENGGLSDARNFGIEQASGEYLGFVDGDDFVRREMFGEMYNLAEKHEAEMVICNLQKVNEKGEILQKLEQIPHLPEKILLKDHFSVFSDISYFACNKVFRSTLFQTKKFKKGIHFEDIELIPQLLLGCKTLAHTSAFHYQYLERSGSISRTHSEKGLDILAAVLAVEQAFKNSAYSQEIGALQGFQILEGVYTFLAYLAFVRDEQTYFKMAEALECFREERKIGIRKILQYRRFGKNYFFGLPVKKQLYYLMALYGQHGWIRKLIR